MNLFDLAALVGPGRGKPTGPSDPSCWPSRRSRSLRAIGP